MNEIEEALFEAYNQIEHVMALIRRAYPSLDDVPEGISFRDLDRASDIVQEILFTINPEFFNDN